ncbi:MarR family winged helix-turn-helix transcriptional regulator [Shewanella metallivivens]|uniref:HTH-type transcriptional regulator SarZ n=2 Tax=Shewanella TaxID=22 RepID=A0ABT5TKD5_9GAMM|nr:MarR family transcriptional regulator [Shewanella metallivivens]MDD8059075.1 MarR family transcriptional regulator [Shewanella metallivivens]
MPFGHNTSPTIFIIFPGRYISLRLSFWQDIIASQSYTDEATTMIEKFETFLSLMKENWPEAYEDMIPSLPLIDKIQSINEEKRSKTMAEYGLQTSDFGLLTALRRTPAPHLLMPTQIMDYMLISSGGLTKALYRLEQKALISRSPSSEDGRVKRVQLTAKGKQVIEEIVVKAQESHRLMNASFSEQEKNQLDMLLRKLLNTLEAPGN